MDLVSKSPVGSSRSNTLGEFPKALAIATLYCSPPDNSEGYSLKTHVNIKKLYNK